MDADVRRACRVCVKGLHARDAQLLRARTGRNIGRRRSSRIEGGARALGARMGSTTRSM